MDIMNDVIKREISAGKRPMALAASIIYLSAVDTAENKTRKDIARAGLAEGCYQTAYCRRDFNIYLQATDFNRW